MLSLITGWLLNQWQSTHCRGEDVEAVAGAAAHSCLQAEEGILPGCSAGLQHLQPCCMTAQMLRSCLQHTCSLVTCDAVNMIPGNLWQIPCSWTAHAYGHGSLERSKVQDTSAWQEALVLC